MIFMTMKTLEQPVSVDSGFGSIKHVIDTLGPPTGTKTRRMVIYNDAVFSDFPFRTENVPTLGVSK